MIRITSTRLIALLLNFFAAFISALQINPFVTTLNFFVIFILLSSIFPTFWIMFLDKENSSKRKTYLKNFFKSLNLREISAIVFAIIVNSFFWIKAFPKEPTNSCVEFAYGNIAHSLLHFPNWDSFAAQTSLIILGGIVGITILVLHKLFSVKASFKEICWQKAFLISALMLLLSTSFFLSILLGLKLRHSFPYIPHFFVLLSFFFFFLTANLKTEKVYVSLLKAFVLILPLMALTSDKFHYEIFPSFIPLFDSLIHETSFFETFSSFAIYLFFTSIFFLAGCLINFFLDLFILKSLSDFEENFKRTTYLRYFLIGYLLYPFFGLWFYYSLMKS